MGPTSFLRASDREEFTSTKENGFITRRRTVANPWLHYFVLTIIVAAGTGLLVYYQSPLGCLIAVLVGSVMTAIAIRVEKLKKILQATEFLSALFSSALASKYRFCIIATTGGEVVYVNRAFQNFYPTFNTGKTTLSALYALAKIDDGDSIDALVAGNRSGMVSLTLIDAAKVTHNVIFEVEPIERPTGFVLIRAK